MNGPLHKLIGGVPFFGARWGAVRQRRSYAPERLVRVFSRAARPFGTPATRRVFLPGRVVSELKQRQRVLNCLAAFRDMFSCVNATAADSL
jgi:hypothetical protein